MDFRSAVLCTLVARTSTLVTIKWNSCGFSSRITILAFLPLNHAHRVLTPFVTQTPVDFLYGPNTSETVRKFKSRVASNILKRGAARKPLVTAFENRYGSSGVVKLNTVTNERSYRNERGKVIIWFSLKPYLQIIFEPANVICSQKLNHYTLSISCWHHHLTLRHFNSYCSETSSGRIIRWVILVARMGWKGIRITLHEENHLAEQPHFLVSLTMNSWVS